MKFEYPEGATPLEYEESIELIPTHITMHSELNEWEASNISEAVSWLENTKSHTLSEVFIKKLHHKMFNHTWKWAGKFRKTNKNIGVEWYEISQYLFNLLEDTKTQIQNASYSTEEIAIRFHHRLVQIHCFPNGNGRHARCASNKLAKELQIPDFTWGSINLTNPSEIRGKYIKALQCADKHSYDALIQFARS
ncbi:MAG: mobile mystery protein B [Pseudomonadota bacterium]|nr:mobile mystery protein B [Pseudomonadota bacterium]